ncbi:MAG TPA: methylmalonyl-CoA epimerase [Pseudolabrys sp.]
MKNLSHVSIVVPDLHAAIKTMQEVHGLASGPIKENLQQGVRLAYIDLGNSKIELMQPLTAESPVGRFLAKHPGGGMHHLCFGVDEVVAETDALKKKGLRVLSDGKPAYNVHGQQIAFVRPADFFGALLELEENAANPADKLLGKRHGS